MHYAHIFPATITVHFVTQSLTIVEILPISETHQIYGISRHRQEGLNANTSESSPSRDIALSPVHGESFDNVIVRRYNAELMSPEVQLSFKPHTSTQKSSMVSKKQPLRTTRKTVQPFVPTLILQWNLKADSAMNYQGC